MAAKTIIVTLRNKKGLVVYQGVFSAEELDKMNDVFTDRFVEIVREHRHTYRDLTDKEIIDMFDIADYSTSSYFK